GYWIFTATASPLLRRARWTCPSDAAAKGSRSKSSKTSSGFLPVSLRNCIRMSVACMGGASHWRSARRRRYGSGSVWAWSESICPSFMNAPFICDMESKMRIAFDSWVVRSISRRRSSDAPILRIPASVLRPTTPAPMRPMRTSRPGAPVGILFPPLRAKRRLPFHRIEDEPERLVEQDVRVLLLARLVVHPEHHDAQVEDPERREDHGVEAEARELALLLGGLEDGA